MKIFNLKGFIPGDIIKNGTVNRGSIFVRAISVIQVTDTKQINFIYMDKEAV